MPSVLSRMPDAGTSLTGTFTQMVVVPKEAQIEGNVAQAFFQRTFGVLGSSDTGERVLNAFLAISSLGNIIVMTYTASRMKQEIAKEGFLPFAKFFAQDADVSVGRLLRWFRSRRWFTSLLQYKLFSPEMHSEKTPVGALVLHFVSCMIIILSTTGLDPEDAYNVLSVSYAYLFPAFFGFFLALGILILRFGTPPETARVKTPMHPVDGPAAGGKRTWTEMTGRSVNPVLSVVCAVMYLIGNAYPIITTWVPPSKRLEDSGVKWFVVPLISWCALGLSSLWFLGFLAFAKRREHRRHQEFVVERHPEFAWADGEEHFADDAGDVRRSGGLVLVHETVSLLWRGRDIVELAGTLSGAGDAGLNGLGLRGRGMASGGNQFAGTDFGDLGRGGNADF